MLGTIKTIIADKGFGFIRSSTDQREFFFHRNALMNCTLSDLDKGDKVEFEVGEGPKGPRAEKVYLA